jgi:hypothetical protein
MSERPTLLSRNIGAPTVQPTQSGAPQGAFGDFRGVEAFGQGMQYAGQVGSNFALNEQARQLEEQKRLQKALEDQQVRDIQSKVKRSREAAQSGVQEKYLAALHNGTLPSDPIQYIDDLMTDAGKQFREHTEQLRTSPYWKKAVSDDDIETDNIAFRNSLLDSALHYSAAKSVSERVGVYNDRAAVLLNRLKKTSDKIAKVDAFIKELSQDNIPRADRQRLQGDLAEKLYSSIHLTIAADGVPVNEDEIRKTPHLPDNLKEALITSSRKLDPKEMGVEDQNRIIDEVHAVLADGKTPTDEQQVAYKRALDAVPSAYKDPDGAASRIRTIQNDYKAAKAFGLVGRIAAEQGTHEDNLALNTAMLGNESAIQYLRQHYPDTNWDSIPSETVTKYRTQAFRRTNAVVEAFSTFQATKILDGLPEIRKTADDLVVSLRRAGAAATPEEANLHAQNAIRSYQGYKALLTAEYDKRHTPADLRPMLPELVMSDLETAYSQEQGASAIAQFHNARAVFGREGTAAIVKRFANSRTGALRDKMHLAAFAGVQHLALFGAQDGTINNTLAASQKEMFDVLSNLPEKRRQWSTIVENHRDLASKVFDSVYFQSNPDAEKVLSGAAIAAARSRTQSLQAMGHGLAWTFGEPSLMPAFHEMGEALITNEALSGAKEAGDRVADFIGAGNATLGRLSQSMAVAKMSLTDNPDRIFGVIPVSMAQQEKWYQTPVFGGASSASQFGEAQTEVIEAASTALYSVIDRTGFGNVPDFGTLLRDSFTRHTWLSWFSGLKLNDSILPLPDQIRIPVGNTDIAPYYAGSRPNENRLFHPNAWGAAGSRATVEALTILENGAFRPNPVSGRYELFVGSAGQPVLGSDDIPNRNYRPVLHEKTKERVGFSIESAMDYHQQFRWKRAIGPLETVFGGEPLTRENPDIINFSEAKIPSQWQR